LIIQTFALVHIPKSAPSVHIFTNILNVGMNLYCNRDANVTVSLVFLFGALFSGMAKIHAKLSKYLGKNTIATQYLR
jgi:hypothetical protein